MTAAPPASTAKTCRGLLSLMPLAFKAAAAEGLSAVYQFEVYGDETFVSHLRIAGGACTFHEGPADNPNLIIKTPADVWLKISRGELRRPAGLPGRALQSRGGHEPPAQDKSFVSRLGSCWHKGSPLCAFPDEDQEKHRERGRSLLLQF